MASQAGSNWFVPSRQAGIASRERINARLHESLDHVLSRCAEHVTVDPASVQRLLQAASGQRRVNPAVFGGLFDLVQQIGTGSLEDVERALTRLFALETDEPEPLAIRPLTPDFPDFDAVLDQFCSDSLKPEQIGTLSADDAAKASARIERALDILQRHAPRTFAETQAVVSEIILADGLPVGGVVFDGCSSLERWGAILLNMRLEKSDLELAETIAHEAGHTALFGLSPVSFFLENDDDRRYKSPLRVDPRPLNGIYHATFVLGRMALAMREVADDPTAPEDRRAEARARAEASAKLFEDGFSVLDEHARYTAEGASIMRDTRAYMNTASRAGAPTAGPG